MGWTVPSTRTTGTLITASIWNVDLVDNLKEIYTSGRIFVSATSLAYNRAKLGDVLFAVAGTFAPSGSDWARDTGVVADPTLTLQAGKSASILEIAGTFTEAGSGTHALLAGVRITAAAVTGAAATVTNTASLYIAGAMSATVTGANYALWVDDGGVRIDQAFALGGGAAPTLGTIGGSGPTVAGQNEWIRIDTQNGVRFVPAWA